MTHIEGATVFITGANGGIGSALVHAALVRGARKVYATARTPKAWDDPRVETLALDVTDAESIAAAVRVASDVTVVVNNAGASVSSFGLLEQTDDEIRRNVETNLVGPVMLARAFAPVLSGPDATSLVDIHSALSWYAIAGIYSATKAGLWSATNSLRVELAPAGVHVLGVHVGYVDTPMAAHADGPKVAPSALADAILDAVEAEHFELLADEASVQAKASLTAPLEIVYPQLRRA